MAQNIYHMLFLKACNRKFRYIVLGPSEEIVGTVPLFFGIDLLSHSGIARSNFSRIHVRYAKKGLATKIMFPEDFSLSGIPTCQVGAWFYSLQGVFQLIFEYQTRQFQLKLASTLFNLWTSEKANPALPPALHVTVRQFRGLRTTKAKPSTLNHLMTLCGMSGRIIDRFSAPGGIGVKSSNVKTNRKRARSDSGGGSDDDGEETEQERQQEAAGGPQLQLPTANSIWALSSELCGAVERFSARCLAEEEYLLTAVAAFLRLVRAKSRERSRDNVFASFLELIANYEALSRDAASLRHFDPSPMWPEVDRRQNALLCAVSEWLGKYLNMFGRSVAQKVDHFKSMHINCVEDLPPPDVVIPDIFPECMLLLLGHWIGMYGTAPPPGGDGDGDTAAGGDVAQLGRKPKQGSRRADHSYSTTVSTAASGNNSNSNNRADHSYSSSTTTQGGGNAVVSADAGLLVGGRKDHTYVAHQEAEDAGAASGGPSQQGTREDHTYVSTRDRRAKADAPGGGGGKDEAAGEGHSLCRRLRLTNVTERDRDKSVIVLDSTKHLLVQLSLEFLNNVLISGFTHVVHARSQRP